MTKETKSAGELAAMIIEGLKAEGVPAASIEVYRIDEPGLEMTWTVRKLRLASSSDVKVEAAVKRVLFPLANRYDLG
jgi:predicted transcriptional regulator